MPVSLMLAVCTLNHRTPSQHRYTDSEYFSTNVNLSTASFHIGCTERKCQTSLRFLLGVSTFSGSRSRSWKATYRCANSWRDSCLKIHLGPRMETTVYTTSVATTEPGTAKVAGDGVQFLQGTCVWVPALALGDLQPSTYPVLGNLTPSFSP